MRTGRQEAVSQPYLSPFFQAATGLSSSSLCMSEIHRHSRDRSIRSKAPWTATLPYSLFASWPLGSLLTPLPAQTGKNTSPSITRVRDAMSIVQLVDHVPFAITMLQHKQNHSFLTNHFPIFPNTTFLSKEQYYHRTEICCYSNN